VLVLGVSVLALSANVGNSRQVQVKQEERIEVDLNKVSAKQAAKQLLFHGKFRLIHR
jgi:hypothetical protein